MPRASNNPAGLSAPLFYLASNTGAAKVYFDAAPSPEPVFQFPRAGSNVRVMADFDASTGKVISGQEVHFDGGIHYSSGRVELKLGRVVPATMSLLRAMYYGTPNGTGWSPATVWYSPDDAVLSTDGTIWELCWDPGQEPFVPTAPNGIGGLYGNYRLDMKFRVVRLVQQFAGGVTGAVYRFP